ncbi:PAS domain S-box protein [Geomonas sp. Red32]|uniref:PAS domain S-box protein n=1 Tax=Geomonas sp. Red32 TaxID=2912856 RepID=UPI00202CDC36|nr:PAS domain S-box protein [Geomonas sp. Red32]MCM0082571.1 PAS domain S-box protein [Geomonas sp. Red32]
MKNEDNGQHREDSEPHREDSEERSMQGDQRSSGSEQYREKSQQHGLDSHQHRGGSGTPGGDSSRSHRLRGYGAALMAAWTVTIAVSFGWLWLQERRNVREMARAEARVAFEKDTLYRKWATSHGGVYVPVDERTPPNPYLSHIPERDLTTPSGRRLTLMNPAYMTRQVFELAGREKSMVRGHITSSRPIRAANAPDPWEEQALAALEKGAREVSAEVEDGGVPSMRLMRPFRVEEGCLKCHASQGYRLGDLRGGISVTVPLAIFAGYSGRVVTSAAVAYGIIWMLGIALLALGKKKLAEMFGRLEASEERYRTVADHTAAWEYWLDPEGNFRWVSPSCEAVSTYSRDEFYDDPGLMLRIIHPDDLPRFQEHLHEEDGPHQLDFRIVTRDGEIRWMAHVCRNVYGADGEPSGRRGSNRDITFRVQAEARLQEQTETLKEEIAERQLAQESLQEQAVLLEEEIAERQMAELSGRLSEEKFSKAFQLAPLIMSITDAKDGRFLDVNERFLELSGYSREEVIGRTSLELGWISPQARQQILGQLGDIDRIAGLVLPFTAKDGRCLECEYYGELITVHDQPCILSVALDVTGQKQLEEQLRHSQKLEAVGQLAGGIAHDFNNILMVILGFGSMVEQAMKQDDPLKEKVGQMLVAAEKASQLTRSLLTFSRKQEMNPQLLDLNDIVLGVEKFLVRIIGENVELRSEPGVGDLQVDADRGQIEQVLINLITNARDAMPKGGVVTVATAPAQAGRDGRLYVLLSVSDTGVGMDQQTSKRIFEPFFTTKELGKGTGLGMAIVHGIVTQHGGFIELDSAPGRGTTFRVYLPLARGEAPAETIPVGEQVKGGDETILVAEDDSSVSFFIESILGQYGYRVIVAADGGEAVERFKENREAIGLVILDLIMPRMNGKEVFDEIRRMDAQVKVLFSSGYSAEMMLDQLELSHGEEFIMKPVQPIMLLRKVRQMLDG